MNIWKLLVPKAWDKNSCKVKVAQNNQFYVYGKVLTGYASFILMIEIQKKSKCTNHYILLAIEYDTKDTLIIHFHCDYIDDIQCFFLLSKPDLCLYLLSKPDFPHVII